jgi:hypothetical protein
MQNKGMEKFYTATKVACDNHLSLRPIHSLARVKSKIRAETNKIYGQ